MLLSDETLKELELRGPAWVQRHELLALIAEVRESRKLRTTVVPVLEMIAPSKPRAGYAQEWFTGKVIPQVRDLLAKLKETP